MPIGLVSADLFEAEFKNISHGRNGKKETPELIRALAAQETISGATIKEVARELNLSESSVSAYKNGATSTKTYHKKDEKLKDSINDTRERISTSAFDKLMRAIDSITEDKLNDAKVNVASAVARDMSQIVKNITPSEDGINVKQAVIVYKPRMREEQEYEVIDVSKSE